MAYTACPTPKVEYVSSLDTYPYDALDDLLYDWYCREQGYVPVEGYGRQDVACARSASSDQWLSSDEVIDSRIEAYVMPMISFAMEELLSDDRIAIMTELRNRKGPAVWRNPRVVDQKEAYAKAKAKIAPILSRKGVEW
ncbi:hypothetical protein PEP31012_03698 [Pandoraea eparura]|uniref:Uncharacterized protein n=1 Tax=Pandoraea eparura TaxID=2508291 RepID=A0A5E4X528_9BURK|nr:hypothetical protein [Pandoraea eparura]VVE31424.1 hypothetical protein PEP31012_03698 [Pandoraea eparura]